MPVRLENSTVFATVAMKAKWASAPVSCGATTRAPAARPPASVLEDLRVLSDFLFECKDVVSEGAYLAASDALKRVWDRAT